MPKKVPPTMGCPAKKFLRKIVSSPNVIEDVHTSNELEKWSATNFKVKDDYFIKRYPELEGDCFSTQDFAFIRDIAYYLLHSINTDSCLTGDNIKAVESFIWRICKQYRDKDIETGISESTVEEEPPTIHQLLLIINSFRLSCHDCLNSKCHYRDPDYPIEEVQKRPEEKND